MTALKHHNLGLGLGFGSLWIGGGVTLVHEVGGASRDSLSGLSWKAAIRKTPPEETSTNRKEGNQERTTIPLLSIPENVSLLMPSDTNSSPEIASPPGILHCHYTILSHTTWIFSDGWSPCVSCSAVEPTKGASAEPRAPSGLHTKLRSPRSSRGYIFLHSDTCLTQFIPFSNSWSGESQHFHQKRKIQLYRFSRSASFSPEKLIAAYFTVAGQKQSLTDRQTVLRRVGLGFSEFTH